MSFSSSRYVRAGGLRHLPPLRSLLFYPQACLGPAGTMPVTVSSARFTRTVILCSQTAVFAQKPTSLRRARRGAARKRLRTRYSHSVPQCLWIGQVIPPLEWSRVDKGFRRLGRRQEGRSREHFCIAPEQLAHRVIHRIWGKSGRPAPWGRPRADSGAHHQADVPRQFADPLDIGIPGTHETRATFTDEGVEAPAARAQGFDRRLGKL